MIQIKCNFQGLIGDALASVPYARYLCEKHRTRAFMTDGFNGPVQALLPDQPFVFTDPTEPVDAVYSMNLPEAWQLNFRMRWRWHMGQIYFAYYKEPVPHLPMCYPMHTVPSGWPSGLVVTPFSRTNSPDNNKFWPHERWHEVIHQLLDAEVADCAYIVGTADDDFSEYVYDPEIICVKDNPLPLVLDMMRTSPLVLGLDNGISHLCHFGGVSRHVMIYADCLPPLLAENPMGEHVRGKFPINITVEQVMDAAARVLAKHTVPA